MRAGLEWISFEDLTPGQGQFDYVYQKSVRVPVGLPEPLIWTTGSALEQQDSDLKKANSNLNLDDYAPYVSNPVPVVVEPPNAQAIYAVLDSGDVRGSDQQGREHPGLC